MFNPIPQFHSTLLLAPFTLGLILGPFTTIPLHAQTIIINRDRYPGQFVPPSGRDSYVNRSPILNASPTRSPIIQPSPISPHRVLQRTIIDRPSSSGTTVLINPTIVIPGGYDYQYPSPYRYPQGSYIYYGSPSGFQIQVGY